MKIHRISGQKRKTLIQFYEPTERQLETARIALTAMQAFLRKLGEVDGPELYAFTSHYRLNFVSIDSHTVPVIARVFPGCTVPSNGPLSPRFHISYPPTLDVGRDDRAWPVRTASNVENAVDLLFMAFRMSAFSPFSSN